MILQNMAMTYWHENCYAIMKLLSEWINNTSSGHQVISPAKELLKCKQFVLWYESVNV